MAFSPLRPLAVARLSVAAALACAGLSAGAIAQTSIKPAADTPAASAGDIAASGPTTPEVAIPETFTEADAQALASEPLAITREFADTTPAEPAPAPHETPGETIKDAKAS